MLGSGTQRRGDARADDSPQDWQARFRLLCECLRDPFVRVAMDGRLVECNALYCELLGYSPEELYALTYQDLTPARWHALEDAIVREQILPRGHSEVYEKEYRRKDGTLVPVELRAVLERDAAGQPLAMWAIVRDIGERKRAEEALFAANRQFEAVMDALPVGVAIVGARGEHLRANRAYERMWGEPRPAVHSVEDYAAFRAWWAESGEPVQPEEWASAQAVQQGKTVVGQRMEIARFDGTRAFVYNSAAPIRDASGRIVGSAVAIVDVTEQAEGEAALRASELRYRTLVDATSALTWSSPPSGLQVEPQPDWVAFTGQSGEEMLGEGWIDAVHPDDRAASLERWTDAVARGVPIVAHEYRIRRHDGEWRWMRTHAAPIRDGSGQVVEWIGMNLDIHERKRGEEALRRSREGLRCLAEGSLAVMAERDLGDMLEALAEADLALTGARFAACAYGAAGGAPVLERTARAPDAADSATPGRSGATLGIAAGGESPALGPAPPGTHPISGHRPEAGCAPPRGRLCVPLGGRNGTAAGTLLVTDKAQGDFDGEDEALLGQLATVAALALQHVQARLSLEESDRRKNDFLAMLGHELRNPLAPILNSLYVLERVAPGGELALDAQATIERQVGHLTRLVDDLLDVTRISRGRIELKRERLDLCDLVRRAVEDHRVAFAQGSLDLALSLPPAPLWASADRTRIAQVIGNLLGNAAKFTPPGGAVAVSLAEDREARQAVLVVRDTGVGIAPEMLARVFEPFAQADTTLDRSRGGLGLGLAVVKGLVELHGGSASLASAGLGAGSEVRVRLPLESAAPHAQPPQARRAGEGAPRRVLLIEDNVDAADSLRLLLTLRGHTVEIARSGPEGIEKARGFGPDLILCDIGLPGMDGFAVARTLRNDDPRLRATRLVALSGYAAPEDAARAQEAGFDAHIAKPLGLATLEGLLGETLQQRAEAAQHAETHSPGHRLP